MITNHFARTRFLEPFRRTFVSLELRHSYSLDLFEQERLTEYSTPTGAVDRGHFSDGGGQTGISLRSLRTTSTTRVAA
jgi:hypothetical protein